MYIDKQDRKQSRRDQWNQKKNRYKNKYNNDYNQSDDDNYRYDRDDENYISNNKKR